MSRRRKRASKPLLIASAGIAAITYLGCNEPTAIGNPKRPPDLTVEFPDIGNPKQPPDMTLVDGGAPDGESGD